MAITPDRQVAGPSVANDREARRFFNRQAWRLMQISGGEFVRQYDVGEFAAELDGPRHLELVQLVMLLPLGRENAAGRWREERPMTQTGIRMTADELARLPAADRRRELIFGELHEMAPAGGEHGYVTIEATYRLRAFIDGHPEIGGALFAAETGFRLSREPDTVRAPDVAYVGPERLARARVAGYPDLAPDLVVEVVSPHDTASDVQRKVEDWLRAGARLVWVLYPATRTAMVYRPDGSARRLDTADDLTGEPVLPGFRCRLGDLFA